MIIQPSPIEYATKVDAGDILFFLWPEGVEHIHLNNTELSRLEDKVGFGSVGLKSSAIAILQGEYPIRKNYILNNDEQNIFRHEIAVQFKKSNRQAQLRLPAAVTQRLSSVAVSTLHNERIKMSEVYAESRGRLVKECWQRPLQSTIVSAFASERQLPDGHSYHHTGVDFRAAIGTPVKASGPGRVAFASQMSIPGKLVVIDHGSGIFSRYMHLSEIRVSQGAWVKKNQILGLSGATGRVEAPHLHWETLWKGKHVDPLRFLAAQEQICDPT